MFASLTNAFNRVLDLPVVSRVRRNHGLEHATLHILSLKFPNKLMAGHSTSNGFRIMADLPLEAVQEGVDEALERLRSGEQNLAVHPNCGTNFVTAGTFAGLAGASAMLGVKRRTQDVLERLFLAAGLATIALIAAQPLGMLLQAKVTTSGDPGEMSIESITITQQGGMKVYFVRTRG